MINEFNIKIFNNKNEYKLLTNSIEIHYNECIIFFYFKLMDKKKGKMELTGYYEVRALKNYLNITNSKISYVSKQIGMNRETLANILDGYEPSDKSRFKIKKYLNNIMDDLLHEVNYDVHKRSIVRPESFKH